MPKCNLDINTIIGFQVESTAEWRRQKADQFPDDRRNLDAAEELERLAADIDRLEGSEIHQRIDELISLSGEVGGGFHEELTEGISAELRNIGFHGSYDSGAAFLEWYRKNLETLLRDHINSDVSTIEPPDLEEQVEHDPAVKAAKAAVRRSPREGLRRSSQATVTIRLRVEHLGEQRRPDHRFAAVHQDRHHRLT
jgi:hypothetical protein